MFIIPIIALLYGAHAQEAAENIVSDQGFDKDLLLKNGVKFSESRIESLLPFAIGILFIIIGALNLTGNELGRTLSWIVTPITFLVVGFVTARQVFARQYVKRAFRKSKDTRLHQIDVDAFIDAAIHVFPFWLKGVQILRFVLATAGSLTVIVLLIIS